jgi:hypothetical protein
VNDGCVVPPNPDRPGFAIVTVLRNHVLEQRMSLRSAEGRDGYSPETRAAGLACGAISAGAGA